MKYRTGSGKAIVAIAHKLAIVVYRIIKEDSDYIELGADCMTSYMYQKDISKLEKMAARRGKDFILNHLKRPEDDES
jgi:hypothetical protein